MATKKTPGKKPSISGEASIPKLTLNMPLDEKKVKALMRCIENGNLRLTVSKVNLASGKFAESWLYD